VVGNNCGHVLAVPRQTDPAEESLPESPYAPLADQILAVERLDVSGSRVLSGKTSEANQKFKDARAGVGLRLLQDSCTPFRFPK
jgi:hypothetical protein